MNIINPGTLQRLRRPIAANVKPERIKVFVKKAQDLDLVSRNFDIIVCAAGANGTEENNRVQIVVPASAWNNGTTPLAALAALAPQMFDLDLAGNRVLTLESGISIYVRNKAALAADICVTVKLRSF